MYPHRIRLRGPWECEPLASSAGTGPRRVAMPCRLGEVGLAGYVGPVRFTRKFGYPGRIDDFERVWLTFADIHGAADIMLNGQPLAHGISGSCEFDVTKLLKPHNHLEVLLLADGDVCGLAGETALEVRCAVHLADVRAVRVAENQVRVSGRAIGNWPGPLDLYILIDGVSTYYAAISATKDATPFEATMDLSGRAGDTIRVDLVEGPSQWFRVDLPLPS